jgi:arylsulfatase A-like enzyme
MKNRLLFALKSFLAIIGLFLAFWFFFAYPSDRRIAQFQSNFGLIDKNSSQSKKQWSVKRRLFRDKLPYRLDVGDAEYLTALTKVEARLPQESQLNSFRFNHSKQLYLPIGLYPFRLDGRDGIFLPAGRSLRVNPGLLGHTRVEAGLWTPGSNATLYIESGRSRESHSVSYLSPDSSVDLNSLWYKAIGKWFHVDLIAGNHFDSWKDFSSIFDLKESDEIQLTCKSHGDGCFISDLNFLGQDESASRNFLVILVDTLRRDAIDPHYAPRMARLAQNSMNFVGAISPGNMTSPSTNALLSCRLPTDLGGWAFSYGVSREERNEFYRSSHKSFPDAFSRNGFSTAMIGSVSLISELYGVGIHHGFDRQIAVETDGFDTAQIARETKKWLTDNASQRFFLYVHLNAPHAPYKAPWTDLFRTWPGIQVFKSYANILRWLYTSEVHYTDRYVDSILRSLDDLGLAENTIVVLLADHGDQMRERRFRDNESGPEFEGSYFDHGATLLDDEIGVPLVIRDPGLKTGVVIPDRVSTIDLGPTLMELAGISGVNSCFGKSLVPYLLGAQTGDLQKRVLASEGFQGRAIIFENRYKYIKSYEPTQKRIHHPDRYFSEQTLYFSKEQLYDLEIDPFEENNLAFGDDGLIETARSLYRRTFGVKEGFELVIESPDGGEIKGQFPRSTEIDVIYGQGSISRNHNGTHLLTDGQKTLVLRIKGWDPEASWLRVGDRPVNVRKTSLRLPVDADIQRLPVESGGEGSLVPFPREASAFIRRIEDSGREERKIRITNPAFESVLREWGYLNDR